MKWPWKKNEEENDMADDQNVNNPQQPNGGAQDPPPPNPMEEKFNLLSSQLQKLETMVTNYQMPQQQPQFQQPPPQAPKFEYYSSRDIAKAMAEGDYEAAEDMRAHNVNTKSNEMKWGAQQELNQLRVGGMQAIEQLSETVSKDRYKHLDIPEVKKMFEDQVKQVTNSGVALNMQARDWIYQQACGANMDKILDKRTQEILRTSQPAQGPQMPTGKSGRADGGLGGGDDLPTPAELWGVGGMQALAIAGRTPDEEARRRGYKDYKSYAKAHAETKEAQ